MGQNAVASELENGWEFFQTVCKFGNPIFCLVGIGLKPIFRNAFAKNENASTATLAAKKIFIKLLIVAYFYIFFHIFASVLFRRTSKQLSLILQ